MSSAAASVCPRSNARAESAHQRIIRLTGDPELTKGFVEVAYVHVHRARLQLATTWAAGSGGDHRNYATRGHTPIQSMQRTLYEMRLPHLGLPATRATSSGLLLSPRHR